MKIDLEEAKKFLTKLVMETAAATHPSLRKFYAELHGTLSAMVQEIADLRAERDAALARVVTIKPLEWVDNADTNLDCDWVDTFGLYEITEDAVLFSGNCSTGQRHSTIKAAKAAAQTDYEARVRAAIQPATDHFLGAGNMVHPAPDTLRQVREALEGWVGAKDALALFERENPDNSTKRWTILMDDVERAEARARATLALLTKMEG